MNKVDSNGLKYLAGSVLGTLGGSTLGYLVGKQLSSSEQSKFKALSTAFSARLNRNPKLQLEYNNLQKEVQRINSLPDGHEKSKIKLTFLRRLNDFLESLSDKERKMYLEMTSLTDKIYKIRSGTGIGGFFIGGLIGFIIASRI